MARLSLGVTPAKVWKIWTLLLLVACCFSVTVRVAGYVPMEICVPLSALASLSVAELYGRSFSLDAKPCNQKKLFDSHFAVIGLCSISVFSLSLLFWARLASGLALFDHVALCRQVNDVILPLSGMVSVACWYRFTFNVSMPLVGDTKNLRFLLALVVAICLSWCLEPVVRLSQLGLMGFEDSARFMAGRYFGAGALLLSSLALGGAIEFHGKKGRQTIADLDNTDGPCPYYNLLRSLERVKLSDRELIVLSLTMQGKSARLIGDCLNLSAPTVGTYRQRGYRKIGVSGKKELLELTLKARTESVKSVERSIGISSFIEGSDCRLSRDCKVSRGRLFTSRTIAAGAFIAAVFFLIPLCFYGLANYSLQAMFSNDVLFYVGIPIKYCAAGCLVLSGIVLAACGMCRSGIGLFARLEANGPSTLGFIVLCAGICCSGALVGESFYSISFGGVLGMIGACTALICIGLSGEVSNGHATALLGRAIKLVCFDYPWVILLFSVAVSFADMVSGLLLSISIDLYSPLIGSYYVGVLFLVAYTVIRVRSNARGEALTPSGYEQIRHLLLGKGLSELQADVAIMTLQGGTTASICTRLLLAPGTVSSYRSRAYAKLGVHDLRGLKELVNSETQKMDGI